MVQYSDSRSTQTIIFQKEIQAFRKYARLNIERKYRDQQKSDNQAAIKELSSYVICAEMVWECLEKINELSCVDSSIKGT